MRERDLGKGGERNTVPNVSGKGTVRAKRRWRLLTEGKRNSRNEWDIGEDQVEILGLSGLGTLPLSLSADGSPGFDI